MNKSTSTQFSLTLALVLFFVGIGFNSASAQSNSNEERVMFIQFQNLNPDDYFKIDGAFKSNDQISVKQACIPAEVLMFSISPSNNLSLDENFNLVKGTVLEKTNLNKVSILAEYSEQDFMDRCKMFRMGGSDNQ